MNRRDFLKSAVIAALSSLLPKMPSPEAGVDDNALIIGPAIENSITDKIGAFCSPHGSRTLLPENSWSGIRKVLPHIPCIDKCSLMPSITGFVPSANSTKRSPDDDAPSFYMKGAPIALPFGMLKRGTNSYSIDSIMSKFNNGDRSGLILSASMLGVSMTEKQLADLNLSQVLSLATMSEMMTTELLMNKSVARNIWDGNPALNEFVGLGSQIMKGIINGETGAPTPALDSDVKDFGFYDIKSSEKDIVEYLSMMSYYGHYLAQASSLDPCKWIIAMHPALWFCLTKVWPIIYFKHTAASSPDWICQYCGSKRTIPLTKCWNGENGCGASKSPLSGYVCTYCGRVYSKHQNVCWDGVDGCEAIESLEKVTQGLEGYFSAISNTDEESLTNWMRKESKIPINGFLYDVVLDDGIKELDNTNCLWLEPGNFASTLYFIPLTILGNRPITYMEYIDYRNPLTQTLLDLPEFWTNRFWTDSGMLSWKIHQEKRDYELRAQTEMRIVLRTPQLAAKLTNVAYKPITNIKEQNESNST